MEENKTKEIIRKYYDELSDEMKESINQIDFKEKFNNVAKDNNLMLDQLSSLQTETILVMLGITKSEDFISNICKELEIDRNQAKKIIYDINREIFSEIRDLSKEKFLDDNNTEPTPPPPTPVIRSPYLNKPAPVVKQAPSFIEKYNETSPVQNVVEKEVEAQIEKALPTPPPPTNLPGVKIPEKINYNPFVKPIDDKSQMDIKKIVSEEDVSHEDIAKIEEMGNFTIERHANETHNDPYREPLI